ncbi:hypothetical protein T484DRAFT_1901983 [Baffinella frigidus]|nr:hypothetical protein T484DRAFT_1901983 [Cryptophyta sp. CCMP2293]
MAWIDESFPPDDSSLGPALVGKHEVVWLGPEEVASAAGASPASLFGSGVSAGDVLEGELDDCYVASALTLLASSRHALVQKLFATTTEQDLAAGRAQVTLWERGEKDVVVVDLRVPCKRGTRRPIFAHCRAPQGFWVQVVEKALAKKYGSFAALRGGNTAEALYDLTGCPVLDYNLEAADTVADIKSGRLWEEVRQHVSRRREGAESLVACARFSLKGGQQAGATGLMQNHAYSVLDARVFRKKTGKEEVCAVRVRNPWGGEGGWTGPLCARSPKWKDLRDEDRAGREDAEGDGAFWMPWSDFHGFFNRLHICFSSAPPAPAASATVEVQRSGGCSNFPSFWTNPAFVLSSGADVSVVVTVLQKDRRKELKGSDSAISYPQVGLTVIKANNASEAHSPLALLPGRHTVIGRSRFWNKREAARLIHLSKDLSSLLLVP